MNFAIANVEMTQTPIIKMEGYETLLSQVEGLAEEMKKVEVTEENIKGSKKLVAQVKQQYDQLDRQRKEVKKQLLKPYEEIDVKMKELKKVLDSGENGVREQIKQLEEQQRQEKRKVIYDLFTELFEHYKIPSIFSFELFLETKHLNKSYSMAKIENDIKVWFLNIQHDIEMFSVVADEEIHVANIVQEYAKNGLQANQAIVTYKNNRIAFNRLRNELGRNQKPTVSIKPQHSDKAPRKTFTLAVYSPNDLNKLIKFANENNIDFSA